MKSTIRSSTPTVTCWKKRELHDYLGGRYSSAPRLKLILISFARRLEWARACGKDPELPRRAGCNFSTSSAFNTRCSTQPGDWDRLVQNPEWACVLARVQSWLAERFSMSARAKRRRAAAGARTIEAAKSLARKSLGLVAGLLPRSLR